MENKQVYIRSLEANDIYSHMFRGKEIKSKYCGMIPFSLELMKLRIENLSTKTVKHSNKEISDDLINVKFKQTVKSGEVILTKLLPKIADMNAKLIKLQRELKKSKTEKAKDKIKCSIEKLEEYRNKLEKFKVTLEMEKDSPKWQGVGNEKLREILYKDGVAFTDENGNQTEYVVYKRSSAKSRTGQCLFIKKSLHKEMINWSRMYLPFQKDMKIDFASLLAYESLVGSALEGTITINPANILIVDDVESKLPQLCNVVRKGEDGCLDSFKEKFPVKNSLFDGESLIDSKYFSDGSSMKLLRNHFFKSAAFNTNIQQFLKDHCPNEVEYEEWQINNMFGDPIFAKDIHFIITPSSLKALKFSFVIGGEKDMWNYWKILVEKDGCIFGVCKHEKKSKRGFDENGNVMQQTSYQMINSMPMKKDDIKKLITFFEKNYINNLKNNDDFFIEHIVEGANAINSNMMFADLYKRNNDIVNTKIFRDFRKAEVNKQVTHIKKGKVRLKGDYCVMLGNPMEFLYHAIGHFDVNKSNLALKGNEIYTTMFKFNKKLVGFRNPNTSASNVLIAKNTCNDDIRKYFNLSNNIVCVNSVRFAIQDILSSCDYDSDTIVLFDNLALLQSAKKCFGKYLVCINDVDSQKKTYKLNNIDMAIIDNQLSQSQKFIGRVVNLGQLCNSLYWDFMKNGKTKKELEGLFNKVDIMTILSTICIDMAKKFYELDIDQEIKNVEKQVIDALQGEEEEGKDSKGNIKIKHVKKQPNFFKYVSQSDTIKNRTMHYDCPMDYLYEEMNNLPYAKGHEDVEFTSLLIKQDIKKGNREQEGKILDYVETMCGKINEVYAKFGDNDEEERNEILDDIIKYYHYRIEKLTVKPDTMYAMLVHMINNKNKTATKLLNVLYSTQKDVFLGAFKEK